MDWTFLEIVALISAVSAVITILDKIYTYAQPLYISHIKNKKKYLSIPKIKKLTMPTINQLVRN